METRSKWYKWEVLALLTQLKSLGYNGFDMDTESELALSGFQRFEQLEQFKQHENTH